MKSEQAFILQILQLIVYYAEANTTFVAHLHYDAATSSIFSAL